MAHKTAEEALAYAAKELKLRRVDKGAVDVWTACEPVYINKDIGVARSLYGTHSLVLMRRKGASKKLNYCMNTYSLLDVNKLIADAKAYKPRKYTAPDRQALEKEFKEILLKRGFVVVKLEGGYENIVHHGLRLRAETRGLCAVIKKVDEYTELYRGPVGGLDAWLAEYEKPVLETDTVSSMLAELGFIPDIKENLDANTMVYETALSNITVKASMSKTCRMVTVSTSRGLTFNYPLADVERDPSQLKDMLSRMIAYWDSLSGLYKEMQEHARSGFGLHLSFQGNMYWRAQGAALFMAEMSNKTASTEVHVREGGVLTVTATGPATEAARLMEACVEMEKLSLKWRAPEGALRDAVKLYEPAKEEKKV